MHHYNFFTNFGIFENLTMEEILSHEEVLKRLKDLQIEYVALEPYYQPMDVEGREFCCGWLLGYLPTGSTRVLGSIQFIDHTRAIVDIVEDYLQHKDLMVKHNVVLDIKRSPINVDSLGMLEPVPSSLRTELNDFVDKALDEYPSGTLVGSAFPFSKELAFVVGRHGPTMPVLPVTESRPAKVAIVGGKAIGRELKQLLIAHGLEDEIICITDAERAGLNKTSLTDALTIESDSIKAWVQSVKHLMAEERHERKQNQRGKHKLPPYRKGRWG